MLLLPFSWVGQVLSLRSTRCLWHLEARKSPVLSDEALMLALPIFPGSHPPRIVGVHELNFCVRDGNRWTLMTINTNFCGWLLTIVMSNDFSSSNRLSLAHLFVLVKHFLRNW